MDKRLPKEITENKWIRLALRLIPFASFLSVLWVKTSLDNDTYWIIKTGEYICKNGIPTKDFLTIHSNMDLVVQQWLSDIIYYKAYDLLGVIGPLLIVMLAMLVFAGLMYKLCMMMTNNSIRSSIASLLTCASMSSFFVTRPQVFTYCTILIELICLEKYIKDGKIKHLIALPILSVAVVNLHASMWTMLFIFLLPYLANALPIKIKGKSVSCCKILPLIITALIMIPCGMITPYGIKGLSFIFTTSIGDKVNSSINELKPVVLSKSPGDIFMFIIPVLIIACYLIHKSGKTTPRFVLLSIGTGAMMMVYRKLGAYFMIAAVPAVIYYLNDIDIIGYIIRMNEKAKAKPKKNEKNNIPLLVTLICILVFGILIYSFVGFGIDVNDFVKKGGVNESLDEVIYAMDADIKENPVDELRLFNGFNSGAYLEFKGYKTYIDPRADSFVEEANNDFDYLTEYFDVKTGNVYFKQVFDKYDFNYAIVDLNTEVPLYSQISNNDGYTLVFESEDYALYRVVK